MCRQWVPIVPSLVARSHSPVSSPHILPLSRPAATQGTMSSPMMPAAVEPLEAAGPELPEGQEAEAVYTVEIPEKMMTERRNVRRATPCKATQDEHMSILDEHDAQKITCLIIRLFFWWPKALEVLRANLSAREQAAAADQRKRQRVVSAAAKRSREETLIFQGGPEAEELLRSRELKRQRRLASKAESRARMRAADRQAASSRIQPDLLPLAAASQASAGSPSVSASAPLRRMGAVECFDEQDSDGEPIVDIE